MCSQGKVRKCFFNFLTDVYVFGIFCKEYILCHHYPLTNSKLYLKCVESGGDAWTAILAIYCADVDVDFMQIDVKSIAPVFDIFC